MQAARSDFGPSELVEHVMDTVREFTVGEPQSDNITVMVVRFHDEAEHR